MPFYSSTLCGGGGQRGVQDHQLATFKVGGQPELYETLSQQTSKY